MERQRKDNIKKGERTQRPFCFRLDNDLRERLSAVPNKGRFINDAIRDKLHTLGDVWNIQAHIKTGGNLCGAPPVSNQ